MTDLSFENTTKVTLLDGGEALIKAIKNHNIDVKIGVITGHVETNRIYNVIQNLNPDAYLIKSKCGETELGFAIEKMLANDFYYSHEVHQKNNETHNCPDKNGCDSDSNIESTPKTPKD